MKNKIVVEFLKKYWLNYVLGGAFLILSSYVQTLGPKFLGSIIDLLDNNIIDTELVIHYIGMIILIAIGTFITRFIWRYFIMGNARNMECFLRMRLFEHLQKMSMSFFNSRKTGDLMAYAINDIGAVRQTFGPGVALMINGVALSSLTVISNAVSI